MNRIPRSKVHKCLRCKHRSRDWFGNLKNGCEKKNEAYELYGKVKARDFVCDEFVEDERWK